MHEESTFQIYWSVQTFAKFAFALVLHHCDIRSGSISAALSGQRLVIEPNKRLIYDWRHDWLDWLNKDQQRHSVAQSDKTKTNRDSLAHVFPRTTSATCTCFESWLVHCIVRVLCGFSMFLVSLCYMYFDSYVWNKLNLIYLWSSRTDLYVHQYREYGSKDNPWNLRGEQCQKRYSIGSQQDRMVTLLERLTRL